MADRMNIKFTIEAVDKFSKTMANLNRKLNTLQNRADKLNVRQEMKIDVDSEQAQAQISRLERQIEEINRSIKKPKKMNVDSRDVTKQMEVLERGLTVIENRDIIVRTNTRNAGQDITRLGDDIQRVGRDRQLLIEMNMTPALQQVRRFRDEARHEIVPRRGYEVDMNFAPAVREAERTRRYMGELYERQPLRLETTITDVDTGAATARVMSWRALMNRLLRLEARMHVDQNPFRGIAANAQREFGKVMQLMGRMATFSRNSGEIIMHQFISAFAAMSTAIVPIIAVTAANLAHIGVMAGVAGGATLGLMSSFVAAGAGALGFAAVAIPSLKGVFERAEEINKLELEIKAAKAAGDIEKANAALAEMDAIFKGMSPAQLGAQIALRKFKDTYGELVKSMESPVLRSFGLALTAITTILEMARPMIESSVDAVQRLFEAFNQNLEAADVKAFFEYLNTHAAAALQTIVKALGNFFMGLMNVMTAFAPLSVDMQGGFLRMSESFREWTASLGESAKFQQFVDYVRTNWPRVKQIFGDGITGMIQMIAAFGTSGEDFIIRLQNMMGRFKEWSATLAASDGFKKFSDYVITNGPKVTAFFGALIDMVVQVGIALAPMGAWVLGVATSFFQWIDSMIALHPWIAQIITGAASLIGAIGFLIFPLGILRGIFMTLWPIIQLGFGVFMQLAAGIQGIIARVFSAIVAFGGWARIFAVLRTAFMALTGPIGIIIGLIILIAATIYANWGTIGPWITSMWNGISTFFTAWWANVKARFSADIAAISSAVSTGFSAIASFFTTIFSTIWAGLSHFWNGLVEMVSYTVPLIGSAIMSGFSAIGSFFASWWSGVQARFSASMSSIRAGISAFVSGAVSLWNNLRSGVVNAANSLRTGATNAMNSLRSGATNAMNSLRSAVTNAWNSLRSSVTSAANNVRSAVTSAFNSLRSAVTSTVNTARSTATSAFNSLRSSVTSAVQGALSAVRNAFNNMISAVSSAMSRVRSAVSNGWNSVMSFLRGINLASIGRQMIQGLINGITSMAGSLVSAAKGVVDGAISAAKSLLKIKSPSRVFRSIGEYTMMGMQVGIQREGDGVISAVSRVANAMSTAFNPNLDATMGVSGSNAYSRNSYSNASAGFAATRSASARERDAAMAPRVEVPVFLNGREIARASNSEQQRMNQREEVRKEKFRGGALV